MYLDNYIKEITELCQANSVKTLYAFGSVLTDRFTDQSDVDMIVDIQAQGYKDYADRYFNLKFSLEDMLGRHIDLLEASEIRNRYFIEELERRNPWYMDHKIKTWLNDIVVSINQIKEFAPAEQDIKDPKTRFAVERNIEIIGEAMDRILKVEPNILITDSRKIVDTRNRIIHAYENVSPRILWLIIDESLPTLLNEVKMLLAP